MDIDPSLVPVYHDAKVSLGSIISEDCRSDESKAEKPADEKQQSTRSKSKKKKLSTK